MIRNDSFYREYNLLSFYVREVIVNTRRSFGQSSKSTKDQKKDCQKSASTDPSS